jgi:hypothetical protein
MRCVAVLAVVELTIVAATRLYRCGESAALEVVPVLVVVLGPVLLLLLLVLLPALVLVEVVLAMVTLLPLSQQTTEWYRSCSMGMPPPTTPLTMTVPRRLPGLLPSLLRRRRR